MNNFLVGLLLGATLMVGIAITFQPPTVVLNVSRFITPIIPFLPLPKAVH